VKNTEKYNSIEYTIYNLNTLIYFIVILVFFILFLLFHIVHNSTSLIPFLGKMEATAIEQKDDILQVYNKSSASYWIAPDITNIKGSALESQILYGRELIAHTSQYLGPKGSVMQISNGMNCQNCHLDAGTKIFGNNYGSVSSTFPKFRARSGTNENIYKRVNDCFERSLNGESLDTLSAEMQAIKAYMIFLGSNVEKGTNVKGAGLKDVPYLDRAADPEKGKIVYHAKCASCHMAQGEGIMANGGLEYVYPPLWGQNSYNDGAGLYRLSNLSKYVKYNMPLGATYLTPQLTDEESWDVAAYINSQPRPRKNLSADWPKIEKKPIDHPFGPYSDNFSEKQHKFGPFKPIIENHSTK